MTITDKETGNRGFRNIITTGLKLNATFQNPRTPFLEKKVSEGEEKYERIKTINSSHFVLPEMPKGVANTSLGPIVPLIFWRAGENKEIDRKTEI